MKKAIFMLLAIGAVLTLLPHIEIKVEIGKKAKDEPEKEEDGNV